MYSFGGGGGGGGSVFGAEGDEYVMSDYGVIGVLWAQSCNILLENAVHYCSIRFIKSLKGFGIVYLHWVPI